MRDVDYTRLTAADLFDLLHLGSESEEQLRMLNELRGRFLVQASLISEARKLCADLTRDLAEARRSMRDAQAVVSELKS